MILLLPSSLIQIMRADEIACACCLESLAICVGGAAKLILFSAQLYLSSLIRTRALAFVSIVWALRVFT